MERLEALEILKGLKESYYYFSGEMYKTYWISKKGVFDITWGYYDGYSITTEELIKEAILLTADKTKKEIEEMGEDYDFEGEISGIDELKYLSKAKPGMIYISDDEGGILELRSKEIKQMIEEGFGEFKYWDDMNDEEIIKWVGVFENEELICTPLNVNSVFKGVKNN